MSVLVDTCIWTEVLRKKKRNDSSYISLLEKFKILLSEKKIRILGPIRQEILSGLKHSEQFEALQKHLSAFPNETVLDEDYVESARHFNVCRKKGIQGSHIDFLICTVAIRKDWAIWTLDKDFLFYKKHIPIILA